MPLATLAAMRTLEFDTSAPALMLVDQTRLPRETVVVACRSSEDVAHAIRSMQVRGAPAIGVAAAYGLALAALAQRSDDSAEFIRTLETAAALLGATRPTAVNLHWALDRVLIRAREAAAGDGVQAARQAVLQLANQ